tara:strand:+ start:273 stop:488 length:216 start_codon:yes stop_codon:yes gene_type:complete
MTKYAVIPKGTDMSQVFDLTVGKRYEILTEESTIYDFGLYFKIIDDAKFKIECTEKSCNYLNGQDWEIQNG